MIRILHVVSSIRIGSGVMSVIMNYYRSIDKNKVQFDFLAFKNIDVSYENEILQLGGKIHYCSKPSFSLGFFKEMKDFFIKYGKEYAILHCHPIFGSAIFGYFAKKYAQCVIIQHSHTTELSNKKISSIRNFMISYLFKNNVDYYMACSEDAKRLFFWKDKKDIYLLKNSINIDKYQYSDISRKEIRKQYQISDNEFIIGHIGRFSSEKNHSFTIELFNEYVKSNLNAKLLLIGEGNELNNIKNLVHSFGLNDRVIFAGVQSDIGAYLSAMDIFIFPSIFEGFGLAMLEAQANGLPCICTDAIPKEVLISENIVCLSLKEKHEVWVQQIDKLKRIKQIDLKGASIDEMSKQLVKFYENLIL